MAKNKHEVMKIFRDEVNTPGINVFIFLIYLGDRKSVLINVNPIAIERIVGLYFKTTICRTIINRNNCLIGCPGRSTLRVLSEFIFDSQAPRKPKSRN